VDVQVRAVADDRGNARRNGWRPPQAPRLHRREGDPHSPKLKGFWTCNSQRFYYVREIRTPTSSSVTPAISKTAGGIATFHRASSASRLADRCGIVVGSVIGVWWALAGAAFTPSCRVRALVLINRAVPPRRLQEFRQHRHQHPRLSLVTAARAPHNHHGFRAARSSASRQRDRIRVAVIKLLILLRLAKPYKTIEEIAA